MEYMLDLDTPKIKKYAVMVNELFDSLSQSKKDARNSEQLFQVKITSNNLSSDESR